MVPLSHMATFVVPCFWGLMVFFLVDDVVIDTVLYEGSVIGPVIHSLVCSFHFCAKQLFATLMVEIKGSVPWGVAWTQWSETEKILGLLKRALCFQVRNQR